MKMKMMILALQPHKHQEEILLGDMKEHQLQAFVGVGKKKSTETLQSVSSSQKT
jgi:hypothetical protein